MEEGKLAQAWEKQTMQIGLAEACKELAVHVLERCEAWGMRETDQGTRGKRLRKFDLGGPHIGPLLWACKRVEIGQQMGLYILGSNRPNQKWAKDIK